MEEMISYIKEWKPLIEKSEQPMLDFQIMQENGIKRFGGGFLIALENYCNK